jgi:microcystin-dependent protein
MPNNKILYGGIGLAVVVAIIIAFIMMKKEGFNAWANPPKYTSLPGNITPSSPSNVTLANPNLTNLTNSYINGTAVMGSAPYAQSGSFMVESDTMGNISSSASLPIGAIIIWYGPKNVIPVGWVLCDGNNGTPNLSNNNFPEGVGVDGTIGTIGGSNSAPLPTHNHYVYTGDNNDALSVDVNTDNPRTISAYNINAGNSPGYAFADASFAINTSNAGSGGSGDIPTIPPYVGVYYIMKIQ